MSRIPPFNKFANVTFSPLSANAPKPTTTMMPKLPPLGGTGAMPGIGVKAPTTISASAPQVPNKMAAAKPENAAPVLMPIPHSGPVTSIAKNPELTEMKKLPSLKKIAGFGDVMTSIARNIKPMAGAIEREATPSWSVGQKALSKMTPMEGRSLLGAKGAPRIPAMKPPGGPSFSVGREELASMNNQQARGLLGRHGPPPIPKSPGLMDKTVKSVPPPLPGKISPMGHGTVAQRYLG